MKIIGNHELLCLIPTALQVMNKIDHQHSKLCPKETGRKRMKQESKVSSY